MKKKAQNWVGAGCANSTAMPPGQGAPMPFRFCGWRMASMSANVAARILACGAGFLSLLRFNRQ